MSKTKYVSPGIVFHKKIFFKIPRHIELKLVFIYQLPPDQFR
jgi:hypothetical protein